MRIPSQSRSVASADRMLEATRALLQEGGMAAVTVGAVASRAGTSNGSLYHRFGDRTGLLLAAQQRGFEEITAETAEAFALADQALAGGVTRDEVAGALAAAALSIFHTHHGSLRAFLVDASGQAVFEEPNDVFLHALATRVTSWLREHLGASETAAEAAWRVLFSLGAARALLDDDRVSPTPLDDADLAAAVARAVLAITTH